MIEIKNYQATDKNTWDSFLDKSRIDSFLFKRDYMDYHADRFNDRSFLIYRKGKLEALFPGNINDNIFYSHQGLSYGGLISSYKIATGDIMSVFDLINKELKKEGVKEVIYKPVPYIYYIYPSQEDIYVLYRMGAEKTQCNISTAIFQERKIAFSESRKSGIRKAKIENVTISMSDDFIEFWTILNKNLLKNHNKQSVHTLDEILFLFSKFPNNIKLFSCKIDDHLVGGCIIFIMQKVIHVQYIAADEKGKASGALDLLFDELINRKFNNIPVFDFGHSNEQNGKYLNEGLIFQKESFGGRGVVYETYRYLL